MLLPSFPPNPRPTTLLPATVELRFSPKAEGNGHRYRVYVRGRATRVTGIWQNAIPVQTNDAMTWSVTPRGKAYGTIRESFSGAYSGIDSTAFVVDGDWAVQRRSYEIAGAMGERILLQPAPAYVFISADPGLMYDGGELSSIGPVSKAHFVPSSPKGGVVAGWYDSTRTGTPFVGNWMDVEPNDRFARDFQWRNGTRTNKGLRRLSGEDRIGAAVSDTDSLRT